MLSLFTIARALHLDRSRLSSLSNLCHSKRGLHPVTFRSSCLLFLVQDPDIVILLFNLISEASCDVPFDSAEAIVGTQILYLAQEDAVLKDLIVL